MNLQEGIEQAKRILDEGGVSPESVWYQRIVDERVPLEHWHKQAMDFNTCMCGEREAWIKTTLHEPSGQWIPSDERLFVFGLKFWENVIGSRRIKAARTGVAINRRSIELWAEKHQWPDELKQAAVVPLKTL